MKVYTRRGDTGETDLLGAGRVPKHHPRVEAYGAVDELNAVLGACVAASAQADLAETLRTVQSALFDLGAFLATPDPERRASLQVAEPGPEAIQALEDGIDALEAELPPLRTFILPGGTRGAAALHVARTVCRRAERRLVELDRAEPLGANAVRYLNRLSDLLFVMARAENHRAGVPDVAWRGRDG